MLPVPIRTSRVSVTSVTRAIRIMTLQSHLSRLRRRGAVSLGTPVTPYSEKRDRCSWKGQLEKREFGNFLSWKLRNEIGKNEVEKFEPKLENF